MIVRRILRPGGGDGEACTLPLRVHAVPGYNGLR